MLLLDKIFEDAVGRGKPGLDQVKRDVRVVRLMQDVYDTACRLVEKTAARKLERLARFACWPDHNSWIETEADSDGRRLAFVFHGEQQGKELSTVRGIGSILLDEPGKEMIVVPVIIDLPNNRIVLDREQIATDPAFEHIGPRRTDPLYVSTIYGPILSTLKSLMITILALMNSPKLIRVREADIQRLNARRIKRGKYPFHPHHEITIRVDKHIGQITRGLGDGPERAQHFVRAHPRFLVHPRYKNVEVVMVPPHYRGNPELGMRNTCYKVATEKSA